MESQQTSIKEEARRLIDRLPADATWKDLMYEIYVIQEIEAGLKDAEEGRTVSHEEAAKRLGIDPS